MDTKKNKDTIVVTGYFGAPTEETARRIADERGSRLVVIDDEIAAADGRSIKRICMMEGEHSYRNKEFEMLEVFAGSGNVLLCGDGVLYDDMCREIIEECTLVIAGEGMSLDELWEGAKAFADSTYHAFMMFGSDEEKRVAFDKLIERQKKLFKGESND